MRPEAALLVQPLGGYITTLRHHLDAIHAPVHKIRQGGFDKHLAQARAAALFMHADKADLTVSRRLQLACDKPLDPLAVGGHQHGVDSAVATLSGPLPI